MAKKPIKPKSKPFRFAGLMKSAIVGALLTFTGSGYAYGIYQLHTYAESLKPHLHVIQYNPGGIVDFFALDYAAARTRGDTYKIDGPCISGCTFITGTIPTDRVCITPYARMGFHAAWYEDDKGEKKFGEDGTSVSWQLFSPEVIAMLKAKGWKGPEQNQDKLIWLGFDELKTIYRVCAPKE